MYLSKLISLVRIFPSLSNEIIDTIDIFLGRRGTENLFTRDEFFSLLRQRKNSSEILEWMCKEQIIEPYEFKCPHCKKAFRNYSEKCPFCNNELLSDESNIVEYKIIEKNNLSAAEIEVEKNKKFRLEKSSFDILLTILEKKYKKQEESYIIFTDVKDSTEINKKDSASREKICNGAVSFFRKLTEPFFRASKGIYIKPEGDASYILLDNLDSVKRFVKNANEKIKEEEFYNIMSSVNSKKFKIENEEKPLTTFIKMYIAHSVTGNYFQKDILTIDFNAMDAFTFIKRIEKSVKSDIFQPQIEADYNKNFPLCVFSQDNIFEGNNCILHHIDNFGDVNISYSNNESLSKYFSSQN
ncbi:hypothetical protein [Treponema sp.]|uniref:hypothetical protein n=1 Tax=Treponema sp. TaxID=166 RepID=UPI00388EEA68